MKTMSAGSRDEIAQGSTRSYSSIAGSCSTLPPTFSTIRLAETLAVPTSGDASGSVAGTCVCRRIGHGCVEGVLRTGFKKSREVKESRKE